MPLGRMEEVIAELERALEMDPLSSFMHGWLAELLNLGRQYERGTRVVELAIEREPDYWLSHPVSHCRQIPS